MVPLTRGSGAAQTAQPPPSRPGLAEADLVEGLKTSDDRAAEQFVRDYGPAALRVARRFLESEDDAEDAAQEGLIQAIRAIGSFRGDSALGTWVHRIVVNAALKRVGAIERDPTSSLEGMMPVFDRNDCRIEPLHTLVPPVDVLLERRETRAFVRQSIQSLPQGYRVPILLRDIEGYSTREAAEAIGLSEGALKVRLHRARAALKKALEPLFKGGHL